MNTQAMVCDFLTENGIEYKLFEHEAVHSMSDCAALNLPAPHCKNLFLCNRAKTQYYLLLMRADKPFVTRQVSGALGVSRLSFGDAQALDAMLHTHAGAVSPMGLIFPAAKSIRLVCDSDLERLPSIAFHPLSTHSSLILAMPDFLHRFLPLVHHNPTFICIP